MKTSNVLRRVYGVTAALLGVLFFFIIVGVFGLTLAIADKPLLVQTIHRNADRSGDWVSCETYVRMSPEIMVH